MYPADWQTSFRRVTSDLFPLIVLVAGTGVLGQAGVSATRYWFLLGCLIVGYYARRSGPAVHLQTILILFSIAPFLRRIVDLSAGFEPDALMLSGPYLALLPPIFDLQREDIARSIPKSFFVIVACVVYAAMLSIFVGGFKDAASGLLKWLTPIGYGAWLHYQSRNHPDLVVRATNAFKFILPVIGVYAIWQFIDPPAWDRYWMVNIMATGGVPVGLPEPYGPRVFSTMNSAGSFATYAVFGMLLVGIVSAQWQSAIIVFPCMVGILLSTYRTAWFGLITGVIICLLFAATRRRAAVFTTIAAAMVFVILLATPFDEVITKRFETIKQGSNDGSVSERLAEYGVMVSETTLSSFVGHGFSKPTGQESADAGGSGAAGIPLVDGQIILCWYAMGLPISLICFAAISWAGFRTMSKKTGNDLTDVALRAVIAGMMVQFPLANIASGESSVLFWAFVGLAFPPSVGVRLPVRYRLV